MEGGGTTQTARSFPECAVPSRARTCGYGRVRTGVAPLPIGILQLGHVLVVRVVIICVTCHGNSSASSVHSPRGWSEACRMRGNPAGRALRLVAPIDSYGDAPESSMIGSSSSLVAMVASGCLRRHGGNRWLSRVR